MKTMSLGHVVVVAPPTWSLLVHPTTPLLVNDSGHTIPSVDLLYLVPNNPFSAPPGSCSRACMTFHVAD